MLELLGNSATTLTAYRLLLQHPEVEPADPEVCDRPAAGEEQLRKRYGSAAS
jgi:hypothetical protein